MIQLSTEAVQERLYQLLPSIYRQRDKLQGEILRVFMSALESEFQALEADIEGLYDDWFIESCAEWVIPYIAELLGADEFGMRPNPAISERRLVANTIGYRRRKGIAATLEQVVADVTGWQVRVVEYVQQLACTQHLAHIRAGQGGCVDLRNVGGDTGGPFAALAHTMDVRQGSALAQGSGDGLPMSALPGKYHPESLGLFLWRLPAYQVRAALATPATRDAATGRFIPLGGFTFDPLRNDIQLFSLPEEREESGQHQRTGSANVPAPISRAAFAEDLRNCAAQNAAISRYYGPGRSLLVRRNGKPIPPQAVLSADLSRWRHPVGAITRGKQVAIDVALGRILFLDTQPITRADVVEVTYCYGFSGDLGGGPYRRTFAPPEGCTINVYKGSPIDTLKKAIGAWEQYSKAQRKARGCIRILDNSSYVESELSIALSEGSALTIEAAQGMRPAVLVGERLHCHARGANAASLTVHGLLVDGKLEIEGNLKLNVSHCTLLPHGIAMPEQPDEAKTLRVSIDHSIVGPLHLAHARGDLQIQDSIIDHRAGAALDTRTTHGSAGISVSLQRVTVFGQVHLQTLTQASDCIFSAPVLVEERDSGQVGFSYVPALSQTTPRERCLPEPASAQAVCQDLYPIFTSTRYGDAGYARLDDSCPDAILRGAEDGEQMGVFHDLGLAQRRDSLAAVLEEYVPFGFAVDVCAMT